MADTLAGKPVHLQLSPISEWLDTIKRILVIGIDLQRRAQAEFRQAAPLFCFPINHSLTVMARSARGSCFPTLLAINRRQIQTGLGGNRPKLECRQCGAATGRQKQPMAYSCRRSRWLHSLWEAQVTALSEPSPSNLSEPRVQYYR
jgi:hypothetical protein